MRPKNQKPPISIGGSEKLRAIDRPRYMNVPSPAPCHANVAGVGKQSVWGLRIIACSSISTVTSFPKFVNTQKWWALEQFENLVHRYGNFSSPSVVRQADVVREADCR